MRHYLIFFWFCSFAVVTQAQQSDFAGIDFKKADARAQLLKGENLDNLPKLSYDLTHDLPTEVEKFRAIYRWVCGNIANDYNLYIQNKRGRKKTQNDTLKFSAWNKEFTKKVFKILRKDKKTVCTGYAYLIKELLYFANINAMIVDGYGKTLDENCKGKPSLNHSWNAVQINHKWYLCDATWASGVYNLNDYRFEFNYRDDYFLTDPELFAKRHYPIDPKWLLTAKELKIDDFLKAPMVD